MAKLWSEEDINYLEEKWGIYSIPTIAKNLGRSIDSIRIRAHKLGLGSHRYAREEMPLNQFLRALGYSVAPTNIERFKRIGLQIERKVVINKEFNFINLKKFWTWAKKNQSKINFARFEELALGEEPAWVYEKRKMDRLNPAKVNVNRIWTKQEERLLLQKVKNGRYTYRELSKDFNRTEAAIKTKLIKLKSKCRPIQQEPRLWSIQEEEKLKELYEKGYDRKAIAEVLNKSQLSVTAKIGKSFRG